MYEIKLEQGGGQFLQCPPLATPPVPIENSFLLTVSCTRQERIGKCSANVFFFANNKSDYLTTPFYVYTYILYTCFYAMYRDETRFRTYLALYHRQFCSPGMERSHGSLTHIPMGFRSNPGHSPGLSLNHPLTPVSLPTTVERATLQFTTLKPAGSLLHPAPTLRSKTFSCSSGYSADQSR